MASKRPIGAGALENGNDARVVPRADGSPELYAALDLGTNSCRMLIAAPDGDEHTT